MVLENSGPGLDSEIFECFCARMLITILCTAFFSPRSKGGCEVANGILKRLVDEIVNKLPAQMINQLSDGDIVLEANAF